MNVRKTICVAAVLGMAAELFPALAADEASTPKKPRARQELREELQGLSPEERRAKLKEMRERGEGPVRQEMQRRRENLKNLPPEEREAKLKELGEKLGATNREELEKRREELRDLPPEERAARLRELREKAGRPILSEEDRAARRKEIRERLTQQIEQLQKKKADGTLTDAESRRLQRLEEIASRPLIENKKPSQDTE